MRQAYSRHPETPSGALAAALESSNDRIRWGATRVFAAHFSALAKRPEIASALLKSVDDPVTSVRMQTVKGLWQLWFWTPDTGIKENIENVLLASLAKPQPAWVASNLSDAVYNLADENIRYLYNNWVPLLGRPEDRERVNRGSHRREICGRFGGWFRRAEEAAIACVDGVSLASWRCLRSGI
jgi:hypothetical protein